MVRKAKQEKPKVGFGALIAASRDSVGMTRPQLAKKIGQTTSTIARLENEETWPSVAQINALVVSLPLTAERLLRAMGVMLTVEDAAKVAPRLIELAAQMTLEQQAVLIQLAEQFHVAKGGSS